MSYFEHDFVSGSDLKEITKMHHTGSMNNKEGLEEIFEVGTLNHDTLLEPHKANKLHPDYPRAKKMAETVLKDPVCGRLFMMEDFKREHEWYKRNIHGVEGARCKTDGSSRLLSCIFEYKGLSVTTDKAFGDAIMNLDYDLSMFWYLEITGLKHYFMAAVSKKMPDKLFKRYIDRDHPYYKSGKEKAMKALRYWRITGLK